MRKISIRITEQQYEFLEKLVINGEYANISEVIRDAIRLFLKIKKKEEVEVSGKEQLKWKGENV